MLTLLGGVSIFLSSQHQTWLRKPLSLLPGKMIGIIGCLLGLLFFCFAMQLIAAIFTWFVWLMFIWCCLPYLGAWRLSMRKH